MLLPGSKPLSDKQLKLAFFVGMLIALGCTWVATATEQWLLCAIPACLLFVLVGMVAPGNLMLLLVFCLPLSIEYYFSESLATDLPTEPLMVGMMLLTLLLIAHRKQALPMGYIRHPLVVASLIHLAWVGYMILYSENSLVSMKFFAAKFWYIVVFLGLTAILIRERPQVHKYLWALIIPLVIVTIITIIRHTAYDLKFDSVNKVVTPYFRNHVNYAALLSLAVPLVWYLRNRQEPGTFARIFLNGGLVILLAGIFFSFTRGAWVALVAALMGAYLIRLRLLRPVMVGGMAVLLISVMWMASGNRYLNFAPDYNETVYHGNFEDHVAATLNMEDVSSAERVYRWIAAIRMGTERPATGFGPGNFYPYYQRYTVPAFETYISDNEERSTVHNYFLLMWVEQGLPGLFIMAGLCFMALFYTERNFHLATQRADKQWALALGLSFIIILVQIMLSDLIETDKVGAIFFMLLSLLALQHLSLRREAESAG